LTYVVDLRTYDSVKMHQFGSKVVSLKRYYPETQADTHRTECSTWTTIVVGKDRVSYCTW